MVDYFTEHSLKVCYHSLFFSLSCNLILPEGGPVVSLSILRPSPEADNHSNRRYFLSLSFFPHTFFTQFIGLFLQGCGHCGPEGGLGL